MSRKMEEAAKRSRDGALGFEIAAVGCAGCAGGGGCAEAAEGGLFLRLGCRGFEGGFRDCLALQTGRKQRWKSYYYDQRRTIFWPNVAM